MILTRGSDYSERSVVRLSDQPVIIGVALSHSREQLLAFAQAGLSTAVQIDHWPQPFKDESKPLEQAHQRRRHRRTHRLHSMSRCQFAHAL